MDWQSLNFPGKPDEPNNPFLERAKSLAFLAAADQLFNVLMGEDVESRRSFIQHNARDVRFLDI